MKHLPFVVAVLATAGIARADGPARKLTFQQAIDLAIAQNPDLAVAREAVGAAGAHVEGIKAKRLPTLHLEEDARLYTKEYDLAFPGLGSFTLYQRETTTTVVSVSEPLTGLAYLTELIDGARHTENVARSEYDHARLDVAYRAADGYIRVLSARAAAEVAHSSVADIQSELDRAVKLRAADTYTDVDVLRFKSAKAAADQVAVRADSAVQSELAGLVFQLGLTDGDAVDIADDLPPTVPALAMTIEQAQARAIGARPELRGAREKVAAADSARTAARDQYLPDIRVGGTYIHATGVQPFQPENQTFAGLTVSWNVWDWGATHQAVVEAEHNAKQASLSVSTLGDRVKLEVRRDWLTAKASFDNLATAQTQVESAEEAFRLQKVRFEAGAATTTDVLDASTDVARARLAAGAARYEYYLALVTLARAMGDVPRS
jgi:outer membrane protein